MDLALWGLLGSAMFAFANLLACIKDHKSRFALCLFEAVVALFVGTGAAAAFAPSATNLLHRVEPHDARAISTMMGMVFYQAAPSLRKAVTDAIARYARGKLS